MFKIFVLTYWTECSEQLKMKRLYPIRDCQKATSELFYKYEKSRFCKLKAVSCKTVRNFFKDKAFFDQYN